MKETRLHFRDHKGFSSLQEDRDSFRTKENLPYLPPAGEFTLITEGGAGVLTESRDYVEVEH